MQPSQDQTIDRDAEKGMHLVEEGVEKASRLTAQTMRIMKEQIAKYNNRVSIKFESRADDVSNVKAGMQGGLKGVQLRQIVRAGNSIKEVAKQTQSAQKVKLYEDRVLSRAQHEINRDKVQHRRSQQPDQSQKQGQKQSQSQDLGL